MFFFVLKIYMHAYLTFCNLLSEEKQKSIDIESICELLNIVMGLEFRAQVDSFVEYLKVSGCIVLCFAEFTTTAAHVYNSSKIWLEKTSCV